MPSLGHLGSEEEAAMPLQEADSLFMSVEDLGQQVGGLFDPLLGFKALESLAVEAAKLAIHLRGDAGGEPRPRELRADPQLGARHQRAQRKPHRAGGGGGHRERHGVVESGVEIAALEHYRQSPEVGCMVPADRSREP